MSQNVVNVLLTARDNMSAVITGAVRNGAMQAQLLGNAFSAAGEIAGKAFSTFGDMVKTAAGSETDLIAATGALQSVLGGTFGEAFEYSKKLNAEFSKMGAELPGTAENFASIGRILSDDLANSFKRVDGSFDKVGFEDKLMTITRGVGVLSQAAKTSAFEAGFAIQRVIAGDANALKLLFFDKNPVIKNQIVSGLKEQGKSLKDWAKLTQQARLDMVAAALNSAAGPEVIDKLQSSVEGITSGWQSKIFDPTVGALGMLRSLSSRGTRSALDAFRDLLTTTDTFMKELGAIWPFKVDIMVSLYDAFTYLNKLVSAATGVVMGVGEELRKGLDFLPALRKGFGAIPNELGKLVGSLKFGDVFANVLKNISGFFATAAGVFGKTLNFGLRAVSSALNDLTLGPKLGLAMGELVGRGTGIILTFLLTTDWGSVFQILLKLIPQVISAAAGAAVGLVSGLISQLGPLVKAAGSGILSGLSGLASAVTETFSNIGAQVLPPMAEFVSKAISALQRVWSNLSAAVVEIFSGIFDAAKTAMGNFDSGFTGAVQEFFTNFLSQVKNVLTNALSGAMSSVGSVLGSVTTAVGNAANSALAGATAAVSGSTTPSAANVPTTPTPATAPNTSGSSSNPPPTDIGGPAGWTGWLPSYLNQNFFSSASAHYAGAKELVNSWANGQVVSSAYAGNTQNILQKIAENSTHNFNSETAHSAYAGHTQNSTQNFQNNSEIVKTAAFGHNPMFRGGNLSLALTQAYQAGVNVPAILQASVAEKRNAPSGSMLIVANTTETVLTKQQAQTVFGKVGAAFSGTQPVVVAQPGQPPNVNISVNISGAGDVQAVANAVIAQLDYYLTKAELKAGIA
jgi:hypothetical protein